MLIRYYFLRKKAGLRGSVYGRRLGFYWRMFTGLSLRITLSIICRPRIF